MNKMDFFCNNNILIGGYIIMDDNKELPSKDELQKKIDDYKKELQKSVELMQVVVLKGHVDDLTIKNEKLIKIIEDLKKKNKKLKTTMKEKNKHIEKLKNSKKESEKKYKKLVTKVKNQSYESQQYDWPYNNRRPIILKRKQVYEREFIPYDDDDIEQNYSKYGAEHTKQTFKRKINRVLDLLDEKFRHAIAYHYGTELIPYLIEGAYVGFGKATIYIDNWRKINNGKFQTLTLLRIVFHDEKNPENWENDEKRIEYKRTDIKLPRLYV